MTSSEGWRCPYRARVRLNESPRRSGIWSTSGSTSCAPYSRGSAVLKLEDWSMDETQPFSFLRTNRRETQPRSRGVTEIRGPYYAVTGRRYLDDLFEGFGGYVDILKFAGGSFTLMPGEALADIIHVCHAHDVKVSTGSFIEYVLTQGEQAIDHYLKACKTVGFDIVEISTGFVTLPVEDIVRLTRRVQEEGLLAKPEVGIQFGAGGATSAE